MCIVNKCLYLYSAAFRNLLRTRYSVFLFYLKEKKYNSLFTKTFSTSTLTGNTNDTQKKIEKAYMRKTLET